MSRRRARVGALAALALAIGCRDVLGIETRTEGPPLITLPDRCSDCAADPDCAARGVCREPKG